LRSLGFDGPFSGGKHEFMVKGDMVLTVPNPHKGDIGPELLAIVLRQAGISRKQWERV
jgi:predicted RNA binding protein YcfA (HicA-like mRNA interferase family)